MSFILKNNGTYLMGSPQIQEYTGLCFTANTAGSTVELRAFVEENPPISDTAYSRDGVNWTTFTPSLTTGINKITLTNVGDKVYFRNNITSDFSQIKYLKFIMSGSISASGNINSIYDATNFENLTTLEYKYCYIYLFEGCTALTTPPDLPATTLSSYCYQQMFSGCTNLIKVPNISAKTISSRSFQRTFLGCTSLIVSDTQTAEAPYAWTIPSSGTFTDNTTQQSTFQGCAGTRSSDNLTATAGTSVTYYTQNPPIS